MVLTQERYREISQKVLRSIRGEFLMDIFEDEAEREAYHEMSARLNEDHIAEEEKSRLEAGRIALLEDKKNLILRDLGDSEQLPELSSIQDQSIVALVAAYRLGDNFGFLVSGNTGVGKTYFLQSLVGHIADLLISARRYPTRSIFYVSMGRLVQTIRSFAKNNHEDLVQAACLKEFLFLDDFGSEYATDYVKEALFIIFDSRYQKKLPTFITTNLNINDLGEKYGQRFVSRLKEMTVPIHFKGQDRRGAMLKSNIEILKERMRGEA